MKEIKVKIEGISPLIMHNGMGANPIDPRKLPSFLKKRLGVEYETYGEACKWLKKSRNKLHDKLSVLGFYSSLYLNTEEQVIYPAECFERNIVELSKAFKDGRASLANKVRRAVSVLQDAILDFPNKKKPLKDLYDLHRYDTMVKVDKSKVPSTRAKFDQWSCEFLISFEPEELHQNQIKEILNKGVLYGSLERRPKFGRYKLVSMS